MPKLNVDELDRLYQESEECDRKTFAEMRSNILLVAGDHYAKEINKSASKLREQNRINDNAKLRLTQNYLHKVSRYYENQILSKAPGVVVRPRNETEVQDKKSAEQNNNLWKFAKERYKLTDKIRTWVADYIRIGEVWVKLTWNPMKGEFLGYEQAVDPQGQLAVDEMGQPVENKEKPQFRGDFEWVTIPGYDLLRSKSAKTMDESPYFIYRYMAEKKPLEIRYADDEKKLKAIQGDGDSKQTYVIFDQNTNTYQKEDKRVLIQEFYFKPCEAYPLGYFYIKADKVVLEEGELPFGIFPIVGKGFDNHSGTARATSIIKVGRPFQSEINRATSQMATHQVTVGDDKLVYQSGTKLAPGALLPGVRGITYQGQSPQILPGRDGGQFMAYIEKVIQGLFSAVMMDEILMEEQQGQDPYALLFRSMKQQLKFATYGDKFGEFLQDVCSLFIALAKEYYDDEVLAAAIGREDMVNVAEFRTMVPQSFRVDIEEQSEAVDTQLGRQLTLNHVLQYASSALDKEDIGKFLKNMPFMNNKDNFEAFTIRDDMVENDILALERGELPEINPYADNKFYVKMLGLRMSKADFKMLSPEIQENYKMLMAAHQEEEARKLQELKAAESEFIPAGGALIKADMYVPSGPEGKSKRVEIPYQALQWLVDMLEKQGLTQEALANMNQGLQAEIAQRFLGGMGAGSGVPMMPGQGGPPLVE